jgi:DnaJ-domain-containing protein 1
MEGFIDRLADALRSLLGDGTRHTPRSEGRKAGPGSTFRDPDLREAWEELEDYMRGGKGQRVRGGDNPRSGGGRAEGTRPPDESLRQDYSNLEVAFGADIETVKKSYKALMMRYHPDAHPGDEQAKRAALEITKKINESFERIRSREGSR